MKGKLKGLAEELRALLELVPFWARGDVGSYALQKALKLGTLKPEEIFKPPKFITRFEAMGWDRPLKIWWAVVKQLVKKEPEKVFVPYKLAHAPNYELAVRRWKDEMAKILGFRPTRTKEMSMSQQIDQAVERAYKMLNQMKKKKLKAYFAQQKEKGKKAA